MICSRAIGVARWRSASGCFERKILGGWKVGKLAILTGKGWMFPGAVRRLLASASFHPPQDTADCARTRALSPEGGGAELQLGAMMVMPAACSRRAGYV